MYIKLPDRTKYGNEYLGKIIGFKLKLEQMDLNDIKNILLNYKENEREAPAKAEGH